MGKVEQVDSIMLHVRGGDAVIGIIAAILDRLQARAIDAQSGEFFDETAAANNLGSWRAYRDEVISRPSCDPST